MKIRYAMLWMIAAPLIGYLVGTPIGEALADDKWAKSVEETRWFCRYEQAEVTETECLIALGAMI